MLKNKKIFISDVSPDLFLETNGLFVLLIMTILRFTKNIYYFEDLKISNINLELEKIIFEWQNETDNLDQSYHDHYHSTQEIVNFLKDNFSGILYKEYGGILMRLLGGLRGKISLLKELSEKLIGFEKLLLDKKIIGPYSYTFIGKLKQKNKKL